MAYTSVARPLTERLYSVPEEKFYQVPIAVISFPAVGRVRGRVHAPRNTTRIGEHGRTMEKTRTGDDESASFRYFVKYEETSMYSWAERHFFFSPLRVTDNGNPPSSTCCPPDLFSNLFQNFLIIIILRIFP